MSVAEEVQSQFFCSVHTRHATMGFFDHSYYRTGKTVTRLIGRWPYQDQWETRVCGCFTIILFITQIIAQILGLIFFSADNELILELVSPFIVDAMIAIKYVNAVVKVKPMAELLNRLQNDWTLFTKAEEKRILNEYAYIGQLLVRGYIVAVYVTIFVFVTEPLMPKWINFILQSNETVSNRYPVPIYWYVIDMENNFYPILFYEAVCIVVILTITVANDAMFIIFLQHACALFAVVGHQFKNLPKEHHPKEDRNYGDKSGAANDVRYDYYVMCIRNHKRAIEFSDRLEDLYVWNFAVVIALNMPLISVTAVQIVTQADTIQKIIKYSMFASTQMMHLFFDCYLSQRLTDCSAAIQEHITDSEWYSMSLKTQKLVTIVTLRSQTPCRLTAGKLILLSMQTFGVIIKTSVSYFTVMVSMR